MSAEKLREYVRIACPFFIDLFYTKAAVLLAGSERESLPLGRRGVWGAA
jgi:hypothetical protein